MVIQLIYRRATLADAEKIRYYWNKNKDVLGIPFKTEVEKIISANRFFCAEDHSEVIGFCCFKVKQKNPAVQMSHIFVDENYRGMGVASTLIDYAQHHAPQWLPLIVRYRIGAENNAFYQKIKKRDLGIDIMKTMDIQVCEIDRQKLRRTNHVHELH